MRVDLGTTKDGTERWAEVVDFDDMPRRVSVVIHRMFPAELSQDKGGGFSLSLLDRIHDTLLAHLITDWSFTGPVPKGIPEKVADLPRSAYLTLCDAIEEHFRDVMGFTQLQAAMGVDQPAEEGPPEQEKGTQEPPESDSMTAYPSGGTGSA